MANPVGLLLPVDVSRCGINGAFAAFRGGAKFLAQVHLPMMYLE
jgi:hypothetical protein